MSKTKDGTIKRTRAVKRGLAVVAIAVSCVALWSGISVSQRQGREEYPKITVMFSASGIDEKAVSRVAAAVSEITKEKIGCEVEFKCLGGNYSDAMKRMILGGEMADVCFVREIEDMQYILSEGYAKNLEEEIRTYPRLQQAVEESAWGLNTASKVYSIPDNKDQSYYIGFVCKKSLLDGMEIDDEKMYSMEELHDILMGVKARHPEIIPVVSHLGEICESIGEDMNGDGIAVLTRGEDGEYQNQFENFYGSSVFEEWCSTMYEWRGEGLLEEYLTQNQEAQTVRMAEGGFGYFARVKDYVVGNNEYQLGEELVAIRLSGNLIDNTMNPINWCVSEDSKYPEQAAAFLNLLFTDEEVNRICRYGQEDVDYVVDAGGNYVSRQNVETVYKITGWVWPNVNVKRMDKTNQTECSVSPAYGFLFDASQVQEEMDLCGVIVQKYRNALLAGELNPELGIPQMNAELDLAGVEKIVKEKQRQFEEYRELSGH